MRPDGTAQDPASPFLVDFDNAIHKALSLRCQHLAFHPLALHLSALHLFLEHLANGGGFPGMCWPGASLLKSVLSNVVLLLEHTQEKAESAFRARLAKVIHLSLPDGHGLNPVAGCNIGAGAHGQWAQCFREALSEVDPPGSSRSSWICWIR